MDRTDATPPSVPPRATPETFLHALRTAYAAEDPATR
jgi:hypothetical protein